MRVSAVFLLGCLLCAPRLQAQGNPRDFDRPGPAKERELYYAQVRMEINNVLVRWRDAWEQDDASKLAAFYVENASYYPLHAGHSQTRPAIQNHFAGFLRMVGNVSITMTDFGTSGDLAWMTGRLTYYSNREGVQRKLVRTDMIVLRRQRNSDWLIEAHITQEEPEERPLP